MVEKKPFLPFFLFWWCCVSVVVFFFLLPPQNKIQHKHVHVRSIDQFNTKTYLLIQRVISQYIFLNLNEHVIYKLQSA